MKIDIYNCMASRAFLPDSIGTELVRLVGDSNFNENIIITLL